MAKLGNTTIFGDLTTTGLLKCNDNIYINNSSPTICLQDMDQRSAMIHVNSNLLYILRGSATNSTTWSQYNGLWPLTVNLENNDITGGGNITAYSDIRLKTNIVTIDEALTKVQALRGVYYNRNEEPDSNRKMGLIAQETLEVLPEVVLQHEENGMLSIDYGNITALLIEAIKEQQKQIEELKLEVAKYGTAG